MEFRTAATLIAAILSSSTSLAATYQGEGMGTYVDWDRYKAYDLQATVYFAPVSTERRPLQEAAFLDRASNVTASYLRLDSDYDNTDVAMVDLNYYVPNSMFFLGGHFFRVIESADEFNPGYSENDWGLTLGLTPADGLLIYTKYRSAPSLSGSTFGQLTSSSATFENEDYEANISAKYVTELDENGRAWKVEASLVDSQNRDFLYVGGDYFLDPTFSLGLWVEDYNIADNAYGVRTEKFFTPQISLQGSYSDVGRSNAWQVGARFRF